MRSIRVPAFAKVNLRLDVLGRRPDGYHELRTIFQSLTLHDTLVITRTRAAGIELRIAGDVTLAAADVRQNLIWRAVTALLKALDGTRGRRSRGKSPGRFDGGIRIELRKRIPVGAGLGGGSSDAAAAMAGLLRLTGQRIPLQRLLEIASALGADIPFFLFGGRALGTGRGNEIYPQPDLPRRTVLVLSPHDLSIPTVEAYARLDRLSRTRLTKHPAVSKLWSFCALCWSPQEGGVSNDFERAVFQWHPRLGRLRRELLEQGAAEASLAGSGSAVFAIFRNPAQARRAARKFPEDRVFLCTTQSRKAYARALWGSVDGVSRWNSAEERGVAGPEA
jgi:4-diphosphocytidyl-2-C-methyl-D-erythritol kinase